MERKEIESIIEGILFASGDPVSVARLAAVIGVTREEAEQAALALASRYDFDRRGIHMVRMDDKVQLCTRTEYADYIRRALETRKPPALSQAALEVLAIVAYRQPVTRAYVEQVRGVDSTGTMAMLAEKGLIAESGRLDAPGRPALFRTTDSFLRSFGLKELEELPMLEDELEGQLTFQSQEEETSEEGGKEA